jgi:hypothetical protein
MVEDPRMQPWWDDLTDDQREDWADALDDPQAITIDLAYTVPTGVRGSGDDEWLSPVDSEWEAGAGSTVWRMSPALRAFIEARLDDT